MELAHLQAQYHSLNPAHLADDELSHELLVRNVDMRGESRSKQERTLRTLLKAERENKEDIDYNYDGIDLIEELKWCDEKLQAVKSVLEGRKVQKAPDQKFKTKLLHILFRIKRMKSFAEAEEDLNCIAVIAGECIRLLSKFYSILSPLVEVREAELKILNESLRQIREETEQRNVANPVDRQVAIEETNENRNENRENSEHNAQQGRNEDREQDVDLEGAVGGVETVEVNNDRRVTELSEENAKLKDVVNQLMQRIHALETSTFAKPRESDHIKRNISTPLDRRSVESENEAREKVNVEQDFYEWVKTKYGSIESVVDRTRVPVSAHQDIPRISQAVVVDRPKNSRLPVHKWSVRYDGTDNGRKLNEFLKEVEFNARSEGFTEAELFVSAHHLFTRKARSWFMEVNGNNELGTWTNLVRELKSEFLPADIDYQYERLANARRQGPREKFQDYYLDMVRIFRSMSRQWDDGRKFDVLFRNTRVDCRTAMLAANVNSIPRMREFGKKFDSINWQIYARKESRFERPKSEIEEISQKSQYRGKSESENRFQQGFRGGYQGRNFNPNYKKTNTQYEPTKHRKEEVNSQQKFQPKPKVSQGNGQTQDRRQTEPKPSTSETSALQRIVKAYIPVKRGVCLNCHEEGHSFRECREEKHDFCEKCGFLGFSTQLCPYCQSKNLKKTAQ